MRKYFFLFLASILSMSLYSQERIEYLPYGKMDSWTVRYIKESVLFALGNE